MCIKENQIVWRINKPGHFINDFALRHIIHWLYYYIITRIYMW